MKYKLYSGTYCPYCKMVESFLNEHNLLDQVDIIKIDQNQEAANQLIENGGKSQIPCLNYEDQWIYESSDIIDFFKENLL